MSLIIDERHARFCFHRTTHMPLKSRYERHLRAAYTEAALGGQWPRPRRAIRLPSAILLEGRASGGVRIVMGAEAVLANMQSDKAAFEAWALALHLWCGEAAVELDWEVPALDSGHYQRFLYRAEQMRRLFPGWFAIADEARLARSRALYPRAPLVLNISGKSRALTENEILRLLPEAKLEAELIANPEFAARFGLTATGRQFPVGLFEGRVARDRAVFPGNKSAIDIVGVGKAGFWLFELKAGANTPIGALSELLFYTALIRDAAGPDARFSFQASAVRPAVGAGAVACAKAINAVLLLQARHPLLDHPELIATLNAAAARTWNRAPGAVPVTFHLEAI